MADDEAREKRRQAGLKSAATKGPEARRHPIGRHPLGARNDLALRYFHPTRERFNSDAARSGNAC